MFVGAWLHVSVHGWTQSGHQSPWAETPGHPGRVANAWALTLSIHSVCLPTNSQLEMGGFCENPSRLVWMKCPLSPFLCTWSTQIPSSRRLSVSWQAAVPRCHSWSKGPFKSHPDRDLYPHLPLTNWPCYLLLLQRLEGMKMGRQYLEQKEASDSFMSSFLHSLIHPSLIYFFYEAVGYLHSDRPHSRQWILEWTGPDLTSALHPPITWALFLHTMFLPQDVCTCSVLCLNCSSPNSS